jgi:hypothetical protein
LTKWQGGGNSTLPFFNVMGKAGFDNEELIEIEAVELDKHTVDLTKMPDSTHIKLFNKNGYTTQIDSAGNTINLADSVLGIGGLMFSFTDQTAAGIEVNTTNFRLIGRFYFAGTDSIGTTTKIKIMARRTLGSGCFCVKVYDPKNFTTIVEKTGITEEGFDPIDLGTLSNLPSGDSTFEIWSKAEDGGTKAVVDGGAIKR